MQDVLAFPQGPVPCSLANNDGTPKKTNKATLALHLEKQIPTATTVISLPQDTVAVIDVMVQIHKLDADHLTFDDASTIILGRLLNQLPEARVLHLVCDDYSLELSIKDIDRSSRASGGSISYSKIVGGLEKLEKIMSSSTTKQRVIQFFVEDWANNPARRQLLNGRTIYANSGSQCWRISSTGTVLYVFVSIHHIHDI